MSRPGLSRRVGGALLTAALLAVPFAGLDVMLTATAAGAAITNYTDGSIGVVGGIVGGPDGALWFTNKGNNSIGRIDPTTHVVTNYTGTGIDTPTGIAAGPDGNMWFTNDIAAGSIGMIDPTTHVVANYTSGGFSGTDNPNAITAGPDGNMWFTNDGNNSIGAILTNGSGSIFNWSSGTVSNPQGIAAGSDGALWFANNGNNSIGRIDTGGTITNFTDPGISAPVGIAAGPDGALWFGNNGLVGQISTAGRVNTYAGDQDTLIDPALITNGPDGALWFTNPGRSNAIGRVAPEVVSNFTDASISSPGAITSGPDGALWFVNASTDSIGRISTGGVVTNYTGANISFPYGITTGPDGALWFANLGNDSIGRIDPGTHAVTNYVDASISGPLNLVTGSDGALWFPNVGNDSIGRITTSGVVTGYTDVSISQPSNIAAGPDGALWFTNQGSNTIGRIDPVTHAVTNHTDASISNPTGITSGPDGALWFVNNGTDSIGRITTSGAVTNYTGTSISGPSRIVAGPDGALWFVNISGNSIGRITTGGTVSNYADPSMSSPGGITTGPDGALWFTNFANNSIGRLAPTGPITAYYGQGASSPGSITNGPDGALWFTNADNTIVRMTTGGTVTNKFPTVQEPAQITTGSDGALWFTAPFDNALGRMDTSGNVNYYPAGLPGASNAAGITAGSDGDLWYTDHDNPGSIGQMDTGGNVIGNYTDPGHLQDLSQIIAGPDGGLWFTTNNGNTSVGRIDPVTHAITYVSDPSLNGASGFNGLAAGPDGAVWALNTNLQSISRIDTGTETVTAVYTDPLLNTFAFALTAGDDGALWFIDLSRSSIGRMTTDGTVTETLDPNMSNPTYMTKGSDGALYYTNPTNNSVTRADSGGVANAPTGLGGTPGNGQVSLSWTAPVNNGGFALTDYSVSVFDGSGGAATGVTGATTRLIGSAATSFAFTGLTAGTAYRFRVAPVNSAGTGTQSSLSSPVTPFTVPDAPTSVAGTPGNTQVGVSWTAPAGDGGSALTDYSVSVFNSAGGAATGVTGATTRLVGSTTTNLTFTGLTNGTAYKFKVAAVNVVGTGAQSSLSSAVTPALVPGSPTGVSCTAGNAQVGVSWTAPASTGGSPITDYSVSVLDGTGTPATGVTGATTRLVGSATTNFTFTGLTNGTAYTFKVAAVNAIGTGIPSVASPAVTPFTVPSVPAPQAGVSGVGQIALTWIAPLSDGGSAITDYSVSVFASGGGAATGVTGPPTRLVGSSATSYTFTGLTNGTRYDFTVAAVNAAGTGAPSAPTSGTPANFVVPAMLPNPGTAGFDSGYAVNNSVTVRATGQWSPDSSPLHNVGPDGDIGSVTPSFLLPTSGTAHALVGRIGTSGPWTLIGSGPATLNGSGELYLAMNEASGSFADNTGSLQVALAQLNGVSGETAPVAASVTAGHDAVWTIPIVNDGAAAITGITATLHAVKNGSTPLGFNETLMTGCAPGAGNSEVCTLPDVPAGQTQLFKILVPTTGLLNGDAITGDIDLHATGLTDVSGTLGAVTVAACGAACVNAVALPGVPASSSSAPPSTAHPTTQSITLPPDQPGAPPQAPIAITLNSIAPAAAPVADRSLCPITGTATRCSGQISVVTGDFSSFTDKAHPVSIKIVAKWASVVPAGKILMKKDIPGPPIQLPTCVRNATTLKYNTPCARPQFVAGSAATHNLTTTNVILLNGNDVHFARRVVVGPNAPTLVKATAGLKKAIVSWKVPTVTNGAITGYSVTAYISGVAKKTVLYKSALLKETMTGLLTGKTYTFKVVARNAKGTSLLSIASNTVKPT